MYWIDHSTSLLGKTVILKPLDTDHFPALEALAQDRRIWEFYTINGGNPGRLLEVLNAAIVERESGTQFPFVIYHQKDKKIVGSTRFLDIQPQHKKLEIGWTWLHPDYWASAVNLECKLLLLTFCFETLGAFRVQLKTDENNMRSRKAIEKIGGKYEGMLRNDMLRDNGTHRNSAYYSIIDEEWASVKSRLKKRLDEMR